MSSQWLVVGISGVTCGGKSTLATSMHQFFTSFRENHLLNTNLLVDEVHMISQDDYFLPEDDPRHTMITRLNHINWEILSSVDMEKMISDIREIFKENSILYKKIDTNDTLHDHNNHQQPQRISILIVEGFLIFNHPQLMELCQVKFHIHLPYEKCWARRKSRVYNPPDVTGYFEMCVWPMYEKHFQEFRDCENIIFLNGEIPKDKILKFALNCIGRYL